MSGVGEKWRQLYLNKNLKVEIKGLHSNTKGGMHKDTKAYESHWQW